MKCAAGLWLLSTWCQPYDSLVVGMASQSPSCGRELGRLVGGREVVAEAGGRAAGRPAGRCGSLTTRVGLASRTALSTRRFSAGGRRLGVSNQMMSGSYLAISSRPAGSTLPST